MTLPDPRLVSSLRDRLHTEAYNRKQNYSDLLYLYAFRGFLDRLSRSKHQNLFVLKGGQVLLAWGAPLRRPTLDIDLLGYTPDSVANLVDIVKEICRQPIEPQDGLVFSPDLVEGEEIQDDADYRGVRVMFWAHLGSSRVRMQLDVGFSDVITPTAILMSYPSLLGLPEPRILGYPLESVVSEKLQAMVRLGEINSRMKDFYDIWMLSREFNFDGETLQKAIVATFSQRNTEVPNETPAGLSDEFALQKQDMWRKGFFARFSMTEAEIVGFSQVVAELRTFLIPVLQASEKGESFNQTWKPLGPWRPIEPGYIFSRKYAA
jgi:hypothetical protein